MKLFLKFICVFSCVGFVIAPSFQYEKMRNPKSNNPRSFKHLLNKNLYEYPEPLPSPKPRLVLQPSRRLYQGLRFPDEKRVFRRTFEYPGTAVGHQVLCHDLLDCVISFMAVETRDNIPIILRGGAGYRHFTVVVRASPWQSLEGTIRAYCRFPEET